MTQTKWRYLILLYAVPLLILRYVLVMLLESETFNDQIYWYLVVPVLVISLGFISSNKYWGLKGFDVVSVLLLWVFIICSQFFYTQAIQNQVKKIDSLQQVTDYSQFEFFTPTEQSPQLSIDDFQYATEIKKHQVIMGRITIREGLHIEGLAIKNISNQPKPVYLIHEFNHFIRDQYHAPSEQQIDEYLKAAVIELQQMSNQHTFQLVKSQLYKNFLKEVHTNIDTSALNEEHLILIYGEPEFSKLLWSLFFLLATYLAGIFYLNDRFKNKKG